MRKGANINNSCHIHGKQTRSRAHFQSDKSATCMVNGTNNLQEQNNMKSGKDSPFVPV